MFPLGDANVSNSKEFVCRFFSAPLQNCEAAQIGSTWARICTGSCFAARGTSLETTAMSIFFRCGVLVVVFVSLVAGIGRPPSSPASRYGVAFVGGVASLEELLDEFVTAIERRDADRLRALEVTRAEYLGILMPGHVEPGAPLQRVGDEAAEYFYESMATRSAHYLQALLNELGGTRYQIVDYRFGKGVRQYDGYASYRRLRVQALDPAGEPVQIAAGSIVEVEGRFKFNSYIRD
jgi:hypothetical protein